MEEEKKSSKTKIVVLVICVIVLVVLCVVITYRKLANDRNSELLYNITMDEINNIEENTVTTDDEISNVVENDVTEDEENEVNATSNTTSLRDSVLDEDTWVY